MNSKTIIGIIFMCSVHVASHSSVGPDCDRKYLVEEQIKTDKDQRPYFARASQLFRSRLAKQSFEKPYTLSDKILGSIIEFTGTKWICCITKNFSGIYLNIAPDNDPDHIIVKNNWGIKRIKIQDLALETCRLEGTENDDIMIAHGQKIISSAPDDWGNINIWNTHTNLCERILSPHITPITALAILPNNKLASRAALDDTIEVWDLESGERVTTLRDTTTISSLLGFPDSILISGNTHGDIIIWDTDRSEKLRSWKGHDAPIYCLTKLPEERFASGARERIIKIWNGVNGSCINNLTGHTNSITTLVVLPDDTLASRSCDKTIRIWNYHSGHCLFVLDGDNMSMNSPIVTGRGLLISTTLLDNKLKVWKKVMDCACDNESFR